MFVPLVQIEEVFKGVHLEWFTKITILCLFSLSLFLAPTPTLARLRFANIPPCLSEKGRKKSVVHCYFLIRFAAWFEVSDDPERLFADKRLLAK